VGNGGWEEEGEGKRELWEGEEWERVLSSTNISFEG